MSKIKVTTKEVVLEKGSERDLRLLHAEIAKAKEELAQIRSQINIEEGIILDMRMQVKTLEVKRDGILNLIDQYMDRQLYLENQLEELHQAIKQQK